MQFFMQCKELVRTAGMGDIISVTGMIHHETIAIQNAAPMIKKQKEAKAEVAKSLALE